MHQIRELLNRSLVTNMGVQRYRGQLLAANVPPADAERAVLGFAGVLRVSPDLRASRQVVDVVEKAISLGVPDTDSYIKGAAIAAEEDGRQKVGFFGRAGEVIKGLETEIFRKEVDIYTREQRAK